MSSYHIGTLSEASRKALQEVGSKETKSDSPRPVFLQSKAWTKAILSSKTVVSADTRVFRFTLEHPDQIIGLPVGQHLMMRLRDPVTREAIIRSYTPISEGTDKGALDVLVKVYFDTKDRVGGKMTKALDAIPTGHYVDFKGPIGKFEYFEKGRCAIGGKQRFVKRFIMVCGGSGITPIFQVLRAVLKDHQDTTKCLVLDGNREEQDVLLRTEMDDLVEATSEGKCKLIHTLTRPSENWKGLTGRVGKELLEKEVGEFGTSGYAPGEELVLICGPEALEKSSHEILIGLGWKDEHLLFF
jgi:nitrate reductase (NAD(P)H)